MKNKITKACWADIISKAWREPDFKQRLMTNPSAALAELGLEVPAEVNIKIVENSSDSVTLVLPATPDDLEKFAANTLVEFTNCTKHIPVC